MLNFPGTSSSGVNFRSVGLFKKAATKLSLAKVIAFNFDTPAAENASLFQHTQQRILSHQVEMILFFESQCGAKLQNRVVANSIVE
jgi:hypothetical protein